MLKRTLQGLFVLVLLLAVYLVLWPVPIQARAWVAPPVPGYVGPHASNERLANLTLIPLNGEAGPEHLALGKSVKQIASDLARSPHTVHDHVKSLHRKLNASSRGELIARALGHLAPNARLPRLAEGQTVQTKPAAKQTVESGERRLMSA